MIGPLAALDAPEAAALLARSSLRGWTAEALLESARGTGGLVLAAVEGALVGVLVGHTVLDELEIHVVAVDDRARRRGLGRALVEATLAEARARGVTRAFLEVRVSNAAARALYRAVGFVDSDVRRRYYDDGEDALVMELRLS